MTPLAIAGIGVCATGMADWAQAQSVLRADVLPPLLALPRLALDCLPPVERRRANATSRLAISAASQAIEGMRDDDVARLPAVFSSSDGDGEVLASMLAALSQPQAALSPTLFHNSVFNAPAGYWSIGSRARATSTTVSAGAASFLAGLREAHGQVLATGEPVLYIAYDAPFPAALASFERSAEPFACALLLSPPTPTRPARYGRIEEAVPAPDCDVRAPTIPAELHGRFTGNASADALPLLFAIAKGRSARLALSGLDGERLWLDYLP
jgi:Beta-ketoacyl synthase, N-terminal domain